MGRKAKLQDKNLSRRALWVMLSEFEYMALKNKVEVKKTTIGEHLRLLVLKDLKGE